MISLYRKIVATNYIQALSLSVCEFFATLYSQISAQYGDTDTHRGVEWLATFGIFFQGQNVPAVLDDTECCD